MNFYSQVDRQQKILCLRRRGACGASKEIIRGEAREKKNVGFVDEGRKVVLRSSKLTNTEAP